MAASTGCTTAATPSPFRDGVCFRIVGVTEDVTERILAAERHEEQVAYLAHMARLSTVGELMASISHEVNQPLYAIANFSSAINTLLESGGELNREQLRRFNDEIGKNAVRAGEIIRRVRSYVGRGPTQWDSVDLGKVVEDSVALLAAEARRRRVQVKLELAPLLPLVTADAVGIQQVVVNLVRNAMEAMEDESPRERTVVVRSTLHAGSIELAIEDSGAGIHDEELTQLFHPFFTTKPDGMGMGLSISKTIVEAHGGMIWATRNDGGGSTFHFTIPLQPAGLSRNAPAHRAPA
jgi:two-component system, LuxR family, sensor kinase FixL